MPLSDTSHLIYAILTPLFAILFTAFNVRTIQIFVRKFRLSSLALIFLVNICVCDIIVSLVSNNFYLLNLLHPKYTWSTGSIACKLFKTLTMMTNFSQIFCLSILCLDRTRRLVYNIQCQWTKKHGLIFLPLIWLLAGALSLPRLVLFDEKETRQLSPTTNETEVVDYVCKPAGLDEVSYNVLIIAQFVIGYIIPCCLLVITLSVCEVMSARHKQLMGQSSVTSNTMIKNRQLAWTFNLTGILFLIVWTPFFVLSLLDLKYDILGRSDLRHLNFTLRCTLLVFGSAKPLIYLLSLKKYRKCFFKLNCMQSSSEDPDESSPNSSISNKKTGFSPSVCTSSSLDTNPPSYSSDPMYKAYRYRSNECYL